MSSILINILPSSSIEVDSLLLTRVRTIVKFYIWPLLVLFGLTGNCLAILVLTRRRLIRTSTNNYLTILAVFDSCYLILTLFLNFASHPKFSRFPIVSDLTNILRPLADFSSNTATWLIVCFTLERTLAVAKPIYAKRTCSVRRSRRLICSLLIICFLITLPTFFEQNLLREHDDEDFLLTNTTEIVWRLKQREILHKLHRSYLVFICIVIIWIPLILLCICNSILIWYVHRSRRYDSDEQQQQQQMSNSSDTFETTAFNGSKPFYLRRHTRSHVQKRKVTIVLIFCLFVALILWTPQSLSLTYETLIENYSEMSADQRIRLLIFNNFANLFLCLNASIDFILYCFLSEKFARTCREIFCRRCGVPSSKIGQRTRMISFERTSFILGHTPTNIYQQQLAANTTNKYYIQLYDLYRSSSGLKPKGKSKKKNAQSFPMIIKSDRRIFYQRALIKSKFRSNLDQMDRIPSNKNNSIAESAPPPSNLN